ncbi:MAG: succinylglutamate desuccinylase/aspartoacylase family protein, partial [Gammaproteobacteria bacterium]|nr:succinylglutamate desuccinylase/aspartoacylase family protein [Gammaproteobacteria bacterium]
MFKVMYDYPERLLHCTAADLMSVLGAPTLLHLDGEKEQPLFVSVLLHGNEDVGLLAIQKILKKYQGQKLPRPVSVFIGNVQAAALGMRYLNGQQDYNRVWPGVEVEHDSDEHQMMREIVADIRTRKPFAS